MNTSNSNKERIEERRKIEMLDWFSICTFTCVNLYNLKNMTIYSCHSSELYLRSLLCISHN